METDLRRDQHLAAVFLMLVSLTGCGTVTEKTAPCKRPTDLTSFAEDPRRLCGAMHPVNDTTAFAAVGLPTQD